MPFSLSYAELMSKTVNDNRVVTAALLIKSNHACPLGSDFRLEMWLARLAVQVVSLEAGRRSTVLHERPPPLCCGD